MLKGLLEGLVPGLRSLDVGAFAVAVPLSAAIQAWPWVSTTEMLAAATVLAILLLALSARLGGLLSAREARATFLHVSRPDPVAQAVPRKRERPVEPVQPEPRVAVPGPAAAPSRAGEEPATVLKLRRSELVLDQLRSRMDDVSYTPGSPNVLSMTKYLRGDDGKRPDGRAAAVAPGGARASVARSASGAGAVLRIEGVLDVVAVPRLRPTFDALVAERHAAITVDLSSLRLIDSSGVGLIVSLFKRCRGFGGTVSVSGLRDQPLAVFRLLRLDAIFTLP